MKTSGIYKIVNTFNGKYYVGSSNNIERRWLKHFRSLERNRHHNNYLQRAWNKYSMKIFNLIVVKKFPISVSKQELLAEEQKWLDGAAKEKEKTYNLNFNAKGGDLPGEKSVNFGRHRSEIFKKKISKARIETGIARGANNPMFGKSHSQETKEKIRITKMGTCSSEETKLKMSISRLKRCHPNSIETADKFWKFLSPSGHVIEFNNLSLFCRRNGLDKSAMSNVFWKKSNHHKGWKHV